jgi:hypothetical protein
MPNFSEEDVQILAALDLRDRAKETGMNQHARIGTTQVSVTPTGGLLIACSPVSKDRMRSFLEAEHARLDRLLNQVEVWLHLTKPKLE